MLKQAHALTEEIIEWRRDFHMHPETGFDVQRTAGIVADELEKLGYRVRRGVGKTGVVADMGEGGPLVAIRADMDALPILEMNDSEYKSTVDGKMHACGHDSHTAMALAAATILSAEKFPGTVRFLFQPAEEVADEEGKSGAQRMVEDGAAEGIDFVIAQHIDPLAPVGTVAISAGPASGGVDSWFGTIYGKGGHGAHPDKAIDTFYLTAHVILALNAIVSRRLDPLPRRWSVSVRSTAALPKTSSPKVCASPARCASPTWTCIRKSRRRSGVLLRSQEPWVATTT